MTAQTCEGGWGMAMVRRRAAILVAVLLAGAASFASAAGAGPERLDPGFGRAGKLVITPPPGAAEYGNALAALPDGSLIVAGTAIPDPDALPSLTYGSGLVTLPVGPPTPDVPFVSQNLGSVFLLLRILPDGTLDPEFGDGGRVWTDLVSAVARDVGDQVSDQFPVGSSAAYAVAVQPDGKIVVAGTTAATPTLALAIARYLPDGELDASFGRDGIVITDADPAADDTVSALQISPAGRILAAGRSGDKAVLARYFPNGDPDRSFGGKGYDGLAFTGNGFLGATALAVDAKGRIVAAGQGGAIGGPYDFAVARYLAEGIPDKEFGGAGLIVTDLGGTGDYASGVALGEGGTIVAAGSSAGSFALARYLPDGGLDRSFGNDGLVVGESGGAGGGGGFVPYDDGRMVMAGSRFGAFDLDVAVTRFLRNGRTDSDFGGDGALTTDVGDGRLDEAAAIAHQAGGKLAVTGTSYRDSFDALVFVFRYGGGDTAGR
ncbi:MAG: hypothetical protein ACRDY7_11695 [Acidimicrobiia bacterium]